MMNFNLIFIFLWSICGSEGWSDTRQRKFPEQFMFGVASSAYQVEGAWNEDNKGESIWDRFLHERPDLIADGVNGDVAADSYHQYKRDVEMCRELGVDYYRFSISWPRVLPTGLSNEINEQGFKYYDNLIDELLKYNIQPMITLYHFDLPQQLQDLGGWTNPQSVQWFEDYAKVVFDRYAKKVKYWITINQPNSICMEGYGLGVFAPGVSSSGIQDYVCVKNVLLAHARAYRLYQSQYKHNKGMVGISISINWADPKNNDTVNVEATDLFREFSFGLYMNPIWSEDGDFPSIVKKVVGRKSIEQGLGVSRLPILSLEDINLLKGSADFVGMNHYTTVLVESSQKEFPVPSVDDDMSVELSTGDLWKLSKSSWLKSAPYGLYKALLHINKVYDYPTIIITENGWSTGIGLRDKTRANVMRNYLGALLLGLEDGSQVKGYTAWSLMDNVEWTAGTSERFGLYEVDFNSKEKNRTARQSALVYKNIIQSRVTNDGWMPKNLRISIDKEPKRPNEEFHKEIVIKLHKTARKNSGAAMPSTSWMWTLAAVPILVLNTRGT